MGREADAVSSIRAVGAGLLGVLPGEGNLALSPWAVTLALGLTATGARGATRRELLDVLHTADAARLVGALDALGRHLAALAGRHERRDGSSAEISLEVAAALFAESSTTWEPAFLDAVAGHHGTGVHGVDFVTAPEAARGAVNAWTAERTRGRIPEILAPGSVHARTRLVLVDAVALAAPWEKPFPPARPAPFHLLDGSVVEVPTLRAPLPGAALVPGEGWQAVRVPYAGGTLALTVVLPDEAGRAGLADLERRVAGGALPDLLAPPTSYGVVLALPRWTFRTDVELSATLAALGMPSAFDEQADLTGMTAAERLRIDAVAHQVLLAVDEEGTEAVAATAVSMGVTTAPVLEPLSVERPFLFVLHDVEHGTPLFLGRVTDPR